MRLAATPMLNRASNRVYSLHFFAIIFKHHSSTALGFTQLTQWRTVFQLQIPQNTIVQHVGDLTVPMHWASNSQASGISHSSSNNTVQPILVSSSSITFRLPLRMLLLNTQPARRLLLHHGLGTLLQTSGHDYKRGNFLSSS